MPIEAGKSIITEIPETEERGRSGAIPVMAAVKAAGAAAALIIAALAVYAGYGAVAQNHYFDLSEIKISGAEVLKEDSIRESIGGVEGKNIFSLDIKEIGSKLSANPWIESVEIRRQFPSTMIVNIKERVPVFKTVMNGKSWLLDGSGAIVTEASVAEETALPSLYGISPVEGEAQAGGKVAERQVKHAADSLSGLAGYRLLGKYPVLGFDMSGDYVVKALFKNSDTSLIVPRGRWNDVAERLFTVDHILRGKEGAEPVSISLAFPGKVIVTYPEKSSSHEGGKNRNG